MYFQVRLGQLLLPAFVEKSVGLVCSQVIAKAEHPADLGAAHGEDVQVDIDVGALENAVLVPVGLADAQDVAGRFEIGDIARLIGRIGHAEDDVDLGLRGQTGDRG